MKTLALHEMGEVIRRVRKERGLRLEDLADDNISPATVSNIERGVAHVSPEKITYLLEKLDLPMHKLPEILVKEQVELKKTKFDLLTIATLREIDQVDEALQKLETLKLDDNHPYIAHAYYFKGQCYMMKRKWRQAEKALFNALRSSQQSPYQENNMESASYFLLALCQFHQDEISQALDYIDDGLESFDDQGEMKHVKHLLYRQKGLILHQLGRVTEGMQLVQDFWKLLPDVDDIDTILTFYWLRAEFSRCTGLINEAIDYAEQGIDIARRNRKFSNMFDLWTVLGTIFITKQDWDLAEISLKMALKLENLFTPDHRLITVYNRTGLLFLRQDKKEQAYYYFQQAIQHAEKFQNTPDLITNLIMIGDLCESSGEIDQAIHFYKRAIDLADKHNYKEQECHTWYHLARCYDGKDEKAFQHCMRKTYEIKRELKKNRHDFLP